jgi:D-xylose reductase
LSQKKLVRFCKINKIQVTAYSSFGGQSYIELQGSTADESLINNETIKKIATKNNKSTAQILLKWAIQQ